MEKVIKEFDGRPIAYTETVGTQTTIYDYYSRQPLAFYDSAYDMTYELTSRRPVARGNILESFIKRR